MHKSSFSIIALTLLFILLPIKIYAANSGDTWDFAYTGSFQRFPVPEEGLYRLEVWGAQGGTINSTQGGKGGYARGVADLTSSDNVRIYVGGQGQSRQAVAGFVGDATTFPGGFNGGGEGVTNIASGAGSGGGATDIRLNGTGLNNRIIVGGGGGGGGRESDNSTGGAGGGLNGADGAFTLTATPGLGGIQTAGGASVYGAGGPSGAGSFGVGGRGADDSLFGGGGGGGGGYYGGSGASWGGGGGGSSYIGGVLDGNTVAGNRSGSGFARITYLGPPPEWPNDPNLIENTNLTYDPLTDDFLFETTDPSKIYFKIPDSDIEQIKSNRKDLVIESPNFKLKVPKTVLYSNFDTTSTGFKVLEASPIIDTQKSDIMDYLDATDPYNQSMQSMFTFRLFSYEDSSSEYDFDLIQNFSIPLTIELTLDDTSNFNRLGVFYTVPKYDNDGNLADVFSYFAGNAIKYAEDSTKKSRILFATDHFSFYIVREGTPKTFNDASIISEWAKGSIDYLTSLNILSGQSGNNFNPNGFITRADFSIGLNKTLGKPPASYKAVFNDINDTPSHYFAGDILSLNDRRIPDTFGQSYFGIYNSNNPSNGHRKILREEVAVFLGNSYLYESQYIDNLPQINPSTLPPPSSRYQDAANISPSAQKYVSLAYETRLMLGEGNGDIFYFKPQNNLRREEYAVVLANYLKFKNYALTGIGGLSQ